MGPKGHVSSEDVSHMKSRVRVFRCTATVARLKDVDPCACCMGRWIRDAAAQHDAVLALQQQPFDATRIALPIASPSSSGQRVVGMSLLMQQAQVPQDTAVTMESELLGLGAAHVRELTMADWTSVCAWTSLRPFEQRRLLNCISGV